MKKYLLVLSVILLSIIGAGGRQADAYSVKLQKDGIYAEALPDSVADNCVAFFKKHVKKAMKYYKKYETAFKEEDVYTLSTKVPDEYRDFISVAKQIQDSDEIIIRAPFFIYDIGGNVTYEYYFVAEKNGTKLCLFSINIYPETGDVSFSYDKSMELYFPYDEETKETVLYYKILSVTYAEVPEKINVVRDETPIGGTVSYADEDQIKAEAAEFNKKNFDEKKEEIFDYLEKIKKGKVIEKSDKNLKLELKDEYTEPQQDVEEDGNGKVVYIVIGVVVIMGIAAGVILRKKRKRE